VGGGSSTRVAAREINSSSAVLNCDDWVLMVDRTFVSVVPRELLKPQGLVHSQSAPGDLEASLCGYMQTEADGHLHPDSNLHGCSKTCCTNYAEILDPADKASATSEGIAREASVEQQDMHGQPDPAVDSESCKPEGSATTADMDPKQDPAPTECRSGTASVATQTDAQDAAGSSGPGGVSAGKLLRRARRKARLKKAAQEANAAQDGTAEVAEERRVRATEANEGACTTRSVAVAATAEAAEVGLLCKTDQETMKQLLCVLSQRTTRPKAVAHGCAAVGLVDRALGCTVETTHTAPAVATKEAAAASRPSRTGLRITELTLSRYALPISECPFALHPVASNASVDARSTLRSDATESRKSDSLHAVTMKAPPAPTFGSSSAFESTSGSATSVQETNLHLASGGPPSDTTGSICSNSAPARPTPLQNLVAEWAKTLLRMEMHRMSRDEGQIHTVPAAGPSSPLAGDLVGKGVDGATAAAAQMEDRTDGDMVSKTRQWQAKSMRTFYGPKDRVTSKDLRIPPAQAPGEGLKGCQGGVLASGGSRVAQPRAAQAPALSPNTRRARELLRAGMRLAAGVGGGTSEASSSARALQPPLPGGTGIAEANTSPAVLLSKQGTLKIRELPLGRAVPQAPTQPRGIDERPTSSESRVMAPSALGEC